MAIKGAISKGRIASKILEQFPGSFLYNDGKEIRINMTEDSQPVQIKVTLTAAKTIVEGGGAGIKANDGETNFNVSQAKEAIPAEPSDEEKQRVMALLDKLGFDSSP